MHFPYEADIEIEKGLKVSYRSVLEHIWPLLTEERRNKIARVASLRNFNLTIVLENIYDRGNISAVMRSQEAFGFPCVEVIEGSERFKNANRVSSGAEKWLRLRRWTNSTDCWKKLKAEGLQICVTSLQSSKPLHEIDWSRPTALVLGNEKEGVSPELLANADERVIIPMEGFVQSLNISVAGAVSLYHVHRFYQGLNSAPYESSTSRTKHSLLSPEQVDILKAYYALSTLDSAPQILKSKLQRV